MLRVSPRACARLPLAHFNMKHFQSKQKHVLTPANFRDVFSTAMLPQDRLLRQSSTGGGATRVLVLDRLQQVKGVYSPLLCLPHPAVVEGGDNALGLTVKDYLRLITPEAAAEKVPTTMVMISHPYGIGYAAYAADGSLHMPVKNIAAPPELVEQQIKYQQQLQQEQQESSFDEPPPVLDVAPVPSPLATPEYIATIMDAISASFDSYLSGCSTFYYVTRDKTASLRLAELRQEENVLLKAGRVSRCPISFNDKRWVALPDSVLQSDRHISLYTRDRKTNERIVSQQGLTAAVTHGKVELDMHIKAPRAEQAATATATATTAE